MKLKGLLNGKSFSLAVITTVSLALFPIYFYGSMASDIFILDTVVLSILGVFSTLSGNRSAGETREMIGAFPQFHAVIMFYISLLHLTMTGFLLGFVLSLFESINQKVRYYLFSKGRLYVFSEVNCRSVYLAENIFKTNRKNVTIVFAAENATSENETAAPFIDRLKAIDCIIFNKSVTEFTPKRSFFKKCCRIDFFLLKEDEIKNVEDALSMSQKYREIYTGKNVYIHPLNSDPLAISIIDAVAYCENFKIRLIRERQNHFYKLFEDSPLYFGERENRLKILVVGAGQMGIEAVKITSFCGHTAKLHPEIILIDVDPAVKNCLDRDYPELSHKYEEFDNEITFFDADVNSLEFENILRKHTDIGYVITCLNTDILNLKTALAIESIYEKLYCTTNTPPPIIHAFLRTPFFSEIAPKLKYYNKTETKIKLFGNLEEIYTYDNLVNNRFDEMGMMLNRFYALQYPDSTKTIKENIQSADEAYENSEYSRNSSVASAVHSRYKIYSALVELNRGEEFKSQDLLSESIIERFAELLSDETIVEELSKLEHRRWNSYTRSEGWSSVDFEGIDSYYEKTGKNYRNFVAKLHPCLVSYEKLAELDTYLEKKFGKKTDFKETDRIFIRNLPKIILGIDENQ